MIRDKALAAVFVLLTVVLGSIQLLVAIPLLAAFRISRLFHRPAPIPKDPALARPGPAELLRCRPLRSAPWRSSRQGSAMDRPEGQRSPGPTEGLPARGEGRGALEFLSEISDREQRARAIVEVAAVMSG